MFDRILVAYDGSDHAEAALRTATALAKINGAAVHVAHTPQMDTPRIVIGAYVSQLDTPPTDAQVQEAGKHVADKARQAAKAEGVDLAGVHIGRDRPAQFILQTAEQIDADLIVMGRRGLGAVGSLALGSVSQSVVHGATCACMTVL